MKAIVIGTGTVGSAVKKALEEKGHEVVSVGRKSGDYQADISDPYCLKALFSQVGHFEAVACAGDVFPASLEQTTDEQWANSIKGKGMGQINLGRAALPFIAPVSLARTASDAGPRELETDTSCPSSVSRRVRVPPICPAPMMPIFISAPLGGRP